MKKTVLWLLKVGVSGIIALCVLTGFCVLYYNIPVHSETVDGATDYSWEANKFYSRGTEGFAWGRTNNEGYINPFAYSLDKNIDILVMGSSHMEAYQVAMDESASSVLRNLMPDKVVYNIGVAAHNFLVCADNFVAAIDKYKPSDYVILETANLFYSDEQLTMAINETVPDQSSYADGIIGMLQKNQFLRLTYAQLEAFYDNEKKTHNSDTPVAKTRGRTELYDELLKKLSNTASKNGAKLIIVYHSQLKINEDGSVSVLRDEDLSAFFEDICNKNNVEFLDMSETFIQAYQEMHVLPHGFFNSSVGSGHLNENGHKMIANAIYELIRENE